MLKKLISGFTYFKSKNIKFNFCCYHVQIILIMSQQTQSYIFLTKMLQNALRCQITWSRCMLCNILEYWSQTLDIYGHWEYCTSFYFYLWLFNYWEYVIECVFAVEGHIIFKRSLILRILQKSACASLSMSNIEYGDIIIGIFFNQTIFFLLILVVSVRIHVNLDFIS